MSQDMAYPAKEKSLVFHSVQSDICPPALSRLETVSVLGDDYFLHEEVLHLITTCL